MLKRDSDSDVTRRQKLRETLLLIIHRVRTRERAVPNSFLRKMEWSQESERRQTQKKSDAYS